MMLKIRKSKIKVVSVITFLSLLSISYVGLSFYSIPEKVSAADSNGIEEWRRIEDISTMQEMTAEICNNSNLYDTKALIDERGGGYTNSGITTSYTVTKLEDGNCWMTQNLKLSLSKQGILTSSNSNLPESTTWPDASALETLKADWVNDNTKPYYSNNPSSLPISTIGSNNGDYKSSYGYYYNWCAATAGDCTSATQDGDEAIFSICPKGWRLPSATENVEQGKYAYSLNKLISSINIPSGVAGVDLMQGTPYKFELAGDVDNGQYGYGGYKGNYFSSTASNDKAVYVYSIYSFGARSMPSGLYRWYGSSVRCVADPSIHSSSVPTTDTWKNSLSVHVGPTISIDAVSDLEGEVDYTKVLEDNITATVSSNNAYQLLLSAEQTSLLDATQPDNTGIPPVATTVTTPAMPITAGTSAWGIYDGLDTDNTTKLYKAITTTPKVYHNTTMPTEDSLSTIHTFGVGIAVSPSIPNGTYSTSVTVTAVNG